MLRETTSMRHFTLIKYHPCVQLAHLYEHLVTMAVNQRLYTQNTFKYLDYSVNGATDRDGLITLDVEVYTSQSDQLTPTFFQDTSINLSVGSRELPIALQQIIAEEPYRLYIADTDDMLRELTALHRQHWELSPTSIKRNSQPSVTPDCIYMTDQLKVPTDLIKISYILNDSTPELTILHNIFSRFLLLSVTDQLIYQFGYYGKNIAIQPNQTSAVLLTSDDTAIAVNLGRLTTIIRNTIKKLTTPEILHRFITSFHDNYDQMDIGITCRETKQAIDQTLWQKSFSFINLEQIIATSGINISFKQTVCSVSLR